MKRRTFLVGCTAAGALAGCKSAEGPAPEPPVGFPDSLVIPPMMEGTLEGGRRVFELVMQAGTTSFFAGMPTTTWGYQGSLLGPTLRARRGEALTIRVTNDLDETVTTHWHGAHLPAAADGGPHQTIEPGATWVSEWTVDQVATMIWYHPHTMDETARQVYMGLAGAFYLDDDETDALNLPNRYGIDDIPLILQDRTFDADGKLVYSLSMMQQMEGFKGEVFLVNGVIKPNLGVEAKAIRFRILNGSNAGFYRLVFADGTSFQVIGGDSSLLEAPVELTELRISPGERVQIVLDLSGRMGESLMLLETEAGAELLQINVTADPTATTGVPSTLVTLDPVDPAAAVRTRTFALEMGGGGGGGMGGGGMGGGGFTINGSRMALDTINETVPVDDIEIWEISNVSGMRAINHNFHMHGTHFQVLTRNGAPVPLHEQGYKDTVFVGPGDTVRVVVQHLHFTDPDTPYMYHCHVLEHEDLGMMGQFVVV